MYPASLLLLISFSVTEYLIFPYSEVPSHLCYPKCGLQSGISMLPSWNLYKMQNLGFYSRPAEPEFLHFHRL